ncbi:MAG TPA: class I SAM-dependent RNA methyltransferase [Bryobacteraceae bacterium]|nr:class I SAM-dependent RNA methyltransferase [Bryobacteraceae bacterium]
MEFTIEKLVYGGDGLARVDGRVALTPFVLPGETIRAEAKPSNGGVLRGKLLDVISPSPARAQPPCPYFMRCGGCQYQHIDYAEQLAQKRAILRESIERIGKICFNSDIAVIASEPWSYRNRVQLHVENGRVGYREHGSMKLCAIDRCPVSSPKLNEVIAKLNAEIPYAGRYDGTLELFTNEIDLQVSPAARVTRRMRELLDSLGTAMPIEYAGLRVSRNSFFQVNRFLIPKLVEAATTVASGSLALDLYAGAGLFSMALAKRFTRVIAVEAGASAYRDLVQNASRSGAAIESHWAAVEDFLVKFSETPDFILADPPRAGIGKKAAVQLLRIRARRLVLVSCDPATLARDLAQLAAGGYHIESIALIDLFPQTFHLETVVHLAAA